MPKISLFLQIKNKKVRVSHFISHSTNSLLKVSNGFDFLHPLPKRKSRTDNGFVKLHKLSATKKFFKDFLAQIKHF